MVPELGKGRVRILKESLGIRPHLHTSGSGSQVLRAAIAMEEPEMQLKGKKGKAGPRPEQRGQELLQERTDRWQEGAEAGREREGA